MKIMKNILRVFVLCIISILFIPNKVLADNAYIVYSEVKVNEEYVNGISCSYNGEDGEFIEYTMGYEDNNIYSFKLTAYNLIDSEVYTYTLKSDYKDFIKTYTGEELENGVIISGDDGNSIMYGELIDKNNNVIKNKYNDIYFKTTSFKFNYNFDTTNMDDYIHQIAPNGKMSISAIDPEGDSSFAETSITAFLQKYETEDFWLYGGCYDEDGSCSISVSSKKNTSKSKTYPIEFEYVKTNKNIKEKLDAYAKSFKYTDENIEKELFVMEDLETINYKYAVSIYGDSIDTLNSIINYSSEFQKKLNNSNITAILDSRAGWEENFTSGGFGFLNLLYDGVIYSYAPVAGVKQNNVIYVPNSTKDTRVDYINAAYDRIKKYIPDAQIKIEYAGRISDLNFDDQILQLEDIVDVNKTLGEYYTILINDKEYFYFIAKDSSKMKKPLMSTKDLNTDISISAESSDIPLDTIIQAKEIISGDEYKKIVKALNLTSNLTFDLKLYSNSLEKYITKLYSGEFEVKIPIPENFKGKDLAVYFVKENGDKEKYKVDTTSEPGYAIFTTTHFSIYTLGFKEDETITIDANGGVFADGKTTKICSVEDFKCWTEGNPTREGYKFITYRSGDGTSLGLLDPMPSGITLYAQWEKIQESSESNSFKEPIKNEEDVPETFDGISSSLFSGTMSLIVLTGITIYLNKKRKLKNHN